MRKIIITIDDDGRFVDISTEEVGKETEETEEVVERDVTKEATDYSMYARVFDDTCVGWTKNSEYNLAFLKHQEDYLNDLLKTRGYVFLNEVYDAIGIPRTSAGQVVGWKYDKEDPIGGNRVDFGLYDERNYDFINGYKSTVVLDFNVDGNILDLI